MSAEQIEIAQESAGNLREPEDWHQAWDDGNDKALDPQLVWSARNDDFEHFKLMQLYKVYLFQVMQVLSPRHYGSWGLPLVSCGIICV